ncbi:MAG: redoxin domain-containing protein, partial [Acidobacteria bacterium]|nr:redoxin domain-containing protein [Acidobacteriota bacterium]
MELQQYVDAFRKQGLGVCAITYDSVETLADFAGRRGIAFPLLADPKFEIIRAFG